MVRITAVHMEGGEQHEHIGEVRWVNPATNEEGATSRAGMVRWIEQGGRAVVGEGRQQVNVGVVDGSPKYLRTYAPTLTRNGRTTFWRFPATECTSATDRMAAS